MSHVAPVMEKEKAISKDAASREEMQVRPLKQRTLRSLSHGHPKRALSPQTRTVIPKSPRQLRDLP